MEFPGRTLLRIADSYDATFGPGTNGARDLRQAVKAHQELSLRCVEDNTKHSLTIAGLRARIAELEASHSPKP